MNVMVVALAGARHVQKAPPGQLPLFTALFPMTFLTQPWLSPTTPPISVVFCEWLIVKVLLVTSTGPELMTWIA